MAKKRKTRQEKVIADLRRKLQTQDLPLTVESTVAPSAPAYSLPKSNPIIQTSSHAVTSNLKPNTSVRQPADASSTYTYVFSDLRKTVILTIIAIATQIGLFFALAR